MCWVDDGAVVVVVRRIDKTNVLPYDLTTGSGKATHRAKDSS